MAEWGEEGRKEGRKDRVTDHGPMDSRREGRGEGYTIRFIITRDRNSPRWNTISDNRVRFLSLYCTNFFEFR